MSQLENVPGIHSFARNTSIYTRNRCMYPKYFFVPGIHLCTRNTFMYQEYMHVPGMHLCNLCTRNIFMSHECSRNTFMYPEYIHVPARNTFMYEYIHVPGIYSCTGMAGINSCTRNKAVYSPSLL